MKEDDLKKVQELALKQLLDTNEIQAKQISELQQEIVRLKDRLGSGYSNSEIDIHQILEQNKTLSQKVFLLESEMQRSRQEIISNALPTVEKFTTEKADVKDIRKRLFFTAIDSFSLYIIAYLILFLSFNYFTIYAGKQFNFHGTLKYWGIEWLRTFDITFLDTDHILMIFASGPVICLILAGLLYSILKIFKNIYYKYRLFIAWTLMLSLNYFFGNYISGVITGKGFSYVSMALELELSNNLFIVFFMLIIMYILGAVITKPFLYAASSFSLAESQKKFLMYQVLFPSIAGNILILLIKLPEVSAYEFFSMVTLYIMIIPMFYTSSLIFVRNSVITFKKNYRLNSFNKEIVFIALLFLVAVRILIR